MNINATSSTVSSAASNGLSGFSGLDTDSMVEKMLSSYQAKITKEQAKEQQLTWKQEMYREIVDKVNTFQTKYFSATSDSYIGNKNLYQTTAVSSSNASAVTVTSKAENSTEASSIQVAQVATASKISGGKLGEGISVNAYKDAFDVKDTDYDVVFSIGVPKDNNSDGKQDLNSNKVLQFNNIDIKVNLKGELTPEDKLKKINDAIAKEAYGEVVFDYAKGLYTDNGDASDNNASLLKADGSLDLTFSIDPETGGLFYDGKFGLKIGENSGSKGLAALGLSANQATISTTKEFKAGDTFDGLRFMDGKTEKYRTYALNGSDLSTAEVKYTFTANLDGVKKTFSFDESTITALQDAKKTIADNLDPEAVADAKTDIETFYEEFSESFKSAFGTSVTADYTDGNLKITAGLGQKVTFTGDSDIIGIKSGTSTNFSLSTKLADVVGFSYTSIHAQNEETGEFLYEDDARTIPLITTTKTDLTFKINDTEITIDTNKTVQDLINTVNKSAAGVTMSYNPNADAFEIKSNVTGANVDVKLEDNSTTQTFIDDYRAGLDLTDPAGLALDALSDEDLWTHMKTEAEAVLRNPSSLPEALENAQKLIDSVGKGLLSALKIDDPSATSVSGQNAMVNIDGKVLQRASNEFTVGDITYKLNNTTGKYDTGKFSVDGNWETEAGTTDNKAKVSYANYSPDNAVKTFKAFVEDYNTLISELNEKISEKAVYKDYQPLTAEQKKEMSETEIENWEKMAKGGLLRNDTAVSDLLQNLRDVFNQSFGGIALYNIGVGTTSNWQSKGKLEVDENVLKESLNKYGSEIYNMLRGKDGKGGLVNALNVAVNYTANKSTGSPGTLVKIAGIKGYGSEKNNEIYNKLESLSDRIAELQKRYDKRKESLWAQFNAMETAMSNLNTQSGWLA
ncbi:MAG: flagellar filament capping protein FliD [Oscillospiraceae bacterium]|jgi:flagellar capping protein FliD|nr:flagellar filament capping protein FliD [Oscillospiraceae bacterium]